MQISPSSSTARASLLEASTQLAHASYATGASKIVDALQTTSKHVRDAERALEYLCETERVGCDAVRALDEVRDRIQQAIRDARDLPGRDGQLPVGTIDAAYADIEQASDLVYASRWG